MVVVIIVSSSRLVVVVIVIVLDLVGSVRAGCKRLYRTDHAGARDKNRTTMLGGVKDIASPRGCNAVGVGP